MKKEKKHLSKLIMLDNHQCSICFDDFEADDLIVIALCNHRMCFQCSLDHYIVHGGSNCPYCRQVSCRLLVTIIEETNHSSDLLQLIGNHEWRVAISPKVFPADINRLINEAHIKHQVQRINQALWQSMIAFTRTAIFRNSINQ